MTLDEIIDHAIVEDIHDGDHTSLSCIPSDARRSARLLVKAEGILAGVAVAQKVFSRFDPSLELQVFMVDGAFIKLGDVAFVVSGSARSILQAERLVLNIMQRMSAIATLTRRYVDAVVHTKARILDTRKTTPNFRLLEKQAVVIGGGMNHRFGLYDMLMIKDNHHDFCGGISQAIGRARAYLAEKNLEHLKIELEVRNFRELDEALAFGQIDRIMLDNFGIKEMRQAVQIVAGRVETEASGGITLETVREVAETGVDYISVGALTHSAGSLDLSLKAL